MIQAKEKAKELINSCSELAKDFTRGVSMNEFSKQFALLIVDEILNLMTKEFKWDIKHNGNIHYWEEVKQEIERL